MSNNSKRPSDDVLYNLIYVRKAKPSEIAAYYDVKVAAAYYWIAEMRKHRNLERPKHMKMIDRKRPDDFVLYDLFFNRKIEAEKVAEKYNVVMSTVYRWRGSLRKKLKKNPEFKRKMIDESIKRRVTSQTTPVEKKEKLTAPTMPKLPKSNAIPVHPWGTPIVDESIASDVADNDIRHAMLLDTLHNKPFQKEQEKAVTNELKSKMPPLMRKEITMKETLQEQRRNYLKKSKKEEHKEHKEEIEKILQTTKNLFAHKDFLPTILPHLIKHGSLLLSFGKCLCGRKHCLSGRNLLARLEEDGALEPLKELGIQTTVNWRGLIFSIDDVYPVYQISMTTTKEIHITYNPKVYKLHETKEDQVKYDKRPLPRMDE